MNKEKFLEIATSTITDIANEFEQEGTSAKVLLAATMTMQLFVSRFVDNIFNDDELEIER